MKIRGRSGKWIEVPDNWIQKPDTHYLSDDVVTEELVAKAGEELAAYREFYEAFQAYEASQAREASKPIAASIDGYVEAAERFRAARMAVKKLRNET